MVRFHKHRQFLLFFGIFLGFNVFTWMRLSASSDGGSDDNDGRCQITEDRTDVVVAAGSANLLFVGVMTASQYLDTRAVAVYDTWGKNVPGRLKFFTSETSTSNSKIPVVRLRGVDDAYPPQKKSFLTFKYMYDNHLNDFDWFMRADDDLYVRTDRLEDFLRSLDSRRVHYIGQTGLGNKDKIGRLSLGNGQNYCMGGPGMIVSRETLKKMAPNIKRCLRNLYSGHEDVEIGRCITRFANVSCTWAYEMKNLFYHNQSGDKSFSGDLRTSEVNGAMTLHPVKLHRVMYKIHNYFNKLKIEKMQSKAVKLRRHIDAMKIRLSTTKKRRFDPKSKVRHDGDEAKPSLTDYIPEKRGEVVTWNLFDRTVYDSTTDNPHFRMESHRKNGIFRNVMELMTAIKRFDKRRGRVLMFDDLVYGYSRINPVYGIDYVLDALLTYNRLVGTKVTMKVRRHAYGRQSMLRPVVRELSNDIGERIHIILPLYGRAEAFQRFVVNFEDVCLRANQNVQLTIVSFERNTSFVVVVDRLRRRYSDVTIRTLNVVGKGFSRALALNEGARQLPDRALMLFLDVDMSFDRRFLDRVRLNTVVNRRAYFPVVYSQYDPDLVPERLKRQNLYRIDKDSGFWRMYGFGIAAIYKSDFVACDGFNEDIVGWGLEDVDFVTKVLLRTNVSVMRSADPGLVHVYHRPSCQMTVSRIQYQMCVGTVVTTSGSSRTIYDRLASNPKP